jgi:hypothetical protein
MSLVPATFQFKIYPGATFYKRIFYELESKPVDLGEHKVTLILKTEADGAVLLTKNSATNPTSIKLGGILGTIDILLTEEETEKFTWTQAVYELFVKDETLEPDRTDVILRGGFRVVPF